MNEGRQGSALLATCLMGAAGAIVFLALPLLIGLIMDSLGLDEEQAGSAASAYFVAYLLSSASAYFWYGRVEPRKAALAGYLVMASGLLMGTLAGDLLSLCLALSVAGVGGGMLFSLGVALIAGGPSTDRNYGWLLVTQQSLAALFLFGAPRWVVPHWGLAGALCSLALISIVLALSIFCVPGKRAESAHSGTPQVTDPGDKLSPRLALVALVLHFAALSALWAFVERIAVDNQITPSAIGTALSASMLGGLCGALLVTALADRFGHRMPLWLATGLFAAVCAGYAGALDGRSFLLVTGLLSFAWNFILAYQMGIISALDRTGTHSVLIPAAQGLGAALGPVLGGWGITLGGYPALLACVALLCLATAAVFSRLARQISASL